MYIAYDFTPEYEVAAYFQATFCFMDFSIKHFLITTFINRGRSLGVKT